jgi:thioredoxin-dependent peroxiredoxin
MRYAAPAVLLLIALPLAAATPEVGKPAPAFDLPAANIKSVFPDKKDAKDISLADFKGKKNVVLFFYPKAMTKGCTVESCGFRDRAEKFAALDTVLLGISTDKLDAQEKFVKKEMLTFPLLADPEKTTTKAYGALGVAGFASRYTFVIDKTGTLRKVYTKVGVAKHPDEVLDFIKENLTKAK